MLNFPTNRLQIYHGNNLVLHILNSFYSNPAYIFSCHFKSISGNSLSQKLTVSGDAPIKAVTSELVSNCPNISFNSFSEIVEICSKSVIFCGCIFGFRRIEYRGTLPNIGPSSKLLTAASDNVHNSSNSDFI